MKVNSYWLKQEIPSFNAPDEDFGTEALVIGGGISGITAAYLLSQEGVKTALIEANRLMRGASGNTTAKITSQHGMIYDHLVRKMGIELTEMYAKSNESAIDFIRETAKKHLIACDLTTLPAYIYTTKSSSIDNIVRETAAAQKAGINASYLKELNLPEKVLAAVMFHNQAQFHPVKYLNGLIDIIVSNGGKIYEHTRAINIEPGEPNIVKTSTGKSIKAKYIVIATHFPFYDGLGLYFTRLYAERSYVRGVKIRESFPEGMYISAEDPVTSLRYQPFNGEKLILCGGGRHKTGDESSTLKHYDEVLNIANNLYTVTENPYSWSAQDYFTPDLVPYIGALTSNNNNIFVATGYKKWGMTTGTLAGIIIKDLIVSGESVWTPLYNPSRTILKCGAAKAVLKENLYVAKELIKGKVKKAPETIILAKDEGKVIKIDNKRYGAYKDQDGKLYILDITCTHLGCELKWNDAEKSWDCPCHGSRFNYDGKVIEGPAHNPLKREDNSIHPNIK